MRTTNIKFTGLASGLDTESMVSAMTMPYKNKVDKAIQEQKLLELKKDAWKEMNSKIYTFHQKLINDMRLEGTFNQKDVTVSQEGYIDVEEKGQFPDGTHKVTVKELAEGAILKTDTIEGKPSKDTALKLLGITENTIIKIEINGEMAKDIEITSDMTLEQLGKKMKEAGVNANYDENAGIFFVSSKETGSNQSIKVSCGDAAVLEKLGISQEIATGKDSKILYNGHEITSSNNIVDVNGMQIKLLGADENKEITIVSKVNTTAIVDKMKAFVNEYNSLIEEMHKKIDAPYNKSYLPLTDEQKKEMSEEDIKLWNAKVEEGILRKDSTMVAITESMRDILSNTKVEVNGKQYMLADFGITTSSNYKDKGKLVIDEDKLSKMTSNHPDILQSLFTEKPNGTSEGGIGVRLYDDIANRLKGGKLNSSNFLFNDKELNERVSNQKDEVYKLQERLTVMENRYHSQFAAMEKMMSQLNNQSSWLTSQLGGM